MNSLCYFNNRFLDYSDARFHISDLGLQRGYSIFDYFLEMENRIPFLDDYLDRFYTSAKLLNLEVPITRDLLKEKITYLLQHNKLGTSGIKLLLTGGGSVPQREALAGWQHGPAVGGQRPAEGPEPLPSHPGVQSTAAVDQRDGYAA